MCIHIKCTVAKLQIYAHLPNSWSCTGKFAKHDVFSMSVLHIFDRYRSTCCPKMSYSNTIYLCKIPALQNLWAGLRQQMQISIDARQWQHQQRRVPHRTAWNDATQKVIDLRIQLKLRLQGACRLGQKKQSPVPSLPSSLFRFCLQKAKPR